MKKVCILQNGFKYGGTDTFVKNLVSKLNSDEFKTIVILSGGDFPRLGELKNYNIDIKYTGNVKSIKHFFIMYSILKKSDVFQTNIDLFNGPQLFVAWLAGVPIRECHSHNSQQGRELRDGRTFRIRLYQGLMRWLCWTFSNRRGGCSAIAMDFLFGNKWKNDQYSKVIHNGIDLEVYRKPFDDDLRRKQLGLKKKFNICTVGRIDYQKNPFFIVEVMNELFKLRDDCDFVWIGTGEQEKDVVNRIKEYQIEDRIHMLGSRNDVPEILRCSDMFFLPSRFEGLAIVLIEAQAAGLPCVTSTTTTPESNCGSLLYLSLDEDAQYWAQKISDVLDGNIVLKVDEKRLNEYSIEHMVKEMEELFEL